MKNAAKWHEEFGKQYDRVKPRGGGAIDPVTSNAMSKAGTNVINLAKLELAHAVMQRQAGNAGAVVPMLCGGKPGTLRIGNGSARPQKARKG